MSKIEREIAALERYMRGEDQLLISALNYVQKTAFDCENTLPVRLISVYLTVVSRCVLLWFSRNTGKLLLVHSEERSSVYQAMKMLCFAGTGKGFRPLDPADLLHNYVRDITKVLEKAVRDAEIPWEVLAELLDQVLPSLQSEQLLKALTVRIQSLTIEEYLLPKSLSVLFQLYYTHSQVTSLALDVLIDAILSHLAVPGMKTKAVQFAFPLLTDCERLGTPIRHKLPISDLISACEGLEDTMKTYMLGGIIEGKLWELNVHSVALIRPLLTVKVVSDVVYLCKWKWVEWLMCVGYHLSSLTVVENEARPIVTMALRHVVTMQALPFFDIFVIESQDVFQQYIEGFPAKTQQKALQIACLQSQNSIQCSLLLQSILAAKDPALWRICQRRISILALIYTRNRRQGAIGYLPKVLIRTVIVDYL